MDKFGAVYEGCDQLNWAQKEIARVTKPGQATGYAGRYASGADVFIGVSAPNLVTPEMVSTMNKDAIVFACANPTPEIFPEDAKAGGLESYPPAAATTPTRSTTYWPSRDCSGGRWTSGQAISRGDEAGRRSGLGRPDPPGGAEGRLHYPPSLRPPGRSRCSQGVAEAARKSGVARLLNNMEEVRCVTYSGDEKAIVRKGIEAIREVLLVGITPEN